MLVSILIPAYNKASYLHRTLSSVVNQTHSDWELIVVDDGSTDETWGVLMSFKDSLRSDISERIKLIHQVNQGQSVARFNALNEASGDFIALLDADDFWSPKKLELQLEYMQSHPKTQVLLSNYCIYSDRKSPPKAVSFNPIKKKIVGWAATTYYGGLVESTGLFRYEFIRKYLKIDAPEMSGGLEICIRAMQEDVIACLDKYLVGYSETMSGWHLNKENLITSYDLLIKDPSIEKYLQRLMIQGLEYHLFFWKLRQVGLFQKMIEILNLLSHFRFRYFIYASSTILRSGLARVRYVFTLSQVGSLRSTRFSPLDHYKRLQ